MGSKPQTYSIYNDGSLGTPPPSPTARQHTAPLSITSPSFSPHSVKSQGPSLSDKLGPRDTTYSGQVDGQLIDTEHCLLLSSSTAGKPIGGHGDCYMPWALIMVGNADLVVWERVYTERHCVPG
jgi:hypothetical protein